MFLAIYVFYADYLVSNFKFAVNDFVIAEKDIVLIDSAIAIAQKTEDPSSAEYQGLLSQRELLLTQKADALQVMDVADNYIVYG